MSTNQFTVWYPKKFKNIVEKLAPNELDIWEKLLDTIVKDLALVGKTATIHGTFEKDGKQYDTSIATLEKIKLPKGTPVKSPGADWESTKVFIGTKTKMYVTYMCKTVLVITGVKDAKLTFSNMVQQLILERLSMQINALLAQDIDQEQKAIKDVKK